MERLKVESSNIKSVGYDPQTKELVVEFRGGQLYLYTGVPSIVYKKFLEAESKGRFFVNNIKPVFLCSKLVKEDLPMEEQIVEEQEQPTKVVLEDVLKQINRLKMSIEEQKIKINVLDERIKKLEEKSPQQHMFQGRIIRG